MPPSITISPSSLDFGSVQTGLCSTIKYFNINHITGTDTATGTVSTNSPFEITSTTNFSISNGEIVGKGVRFCPTSAGTFNGSATISSNATQNISAVALTGAAYTPAPTTGTIQIRANLGGSSWNGPVNYSLSGPAPINGTTVPVDLVDKPQGSYTLSYNSGGPGGAILSSITPSATQYLPGGGSSNGYRDEWGVYI